jgi:WD40 repeat protein
LLPTILFRAPSGWPTSNGDNVAKSSFIASGGADGIVKIWRSPDPSKKNSWECIATLDHSSFEGRTRASDDEDGIPQIYALQFIDHWQGLASETNDFLMTSSDDYVHLWEMDKEKDDNEKLCFTEVFSIRFTAVDNFGSGVSVCAVTSAGLKVPQPQASSSTATDNAFGGERNPANTIYVFDASYCPENGLLGVALSDGSMRLVNGRGVCLSTLSLPGCRSHLTSFAWDSTGTRLASCVATGHLILWSIASGEGQTAVSCLAILEGGKISLDFTYCHINSMFVRVTNRFVFCFSKRPPAGATSLWRQILWRGRE